MTIKFPILKLIECSIRDCGIEQQGSLDHLYNSIYRIFGKSTFFLKDVWSDSVLL